MPVEELKETLNTTYRSAGLHMHAFQAEAESQEYTACRFMLGERKIVFRIAKTTPKKGGQFVVFWKRAESGVIEPYDVEDDIDFFVVAVHAASHRGQFVFPKDILYKKGILQGKESEGKRAIRVYPAWDTPTSKQAKHTQAWQIEYFFEFTENEKDNIANILKKYTNIDNAQT